MAFIEKCLILNLSYKISVYYYLTFIFGLLMTKAKPQLSFMTHFLPLIDPRKKKGNIEHSLYSIITIAVCGYISGCDHYVAIHAFGKAHEKWLSTFLNLPNGIPSHDTFSRVLSRLNANQFQLCYIDFINSIRKVLPNEVIAIDGKTLRRSYLDKKDQDTNHIVSAYATNQELILGQVKVQEKSNEITAIPELLKLIVLKGAFVTIDAIGCQKEFAKEIVEKNADFCFNVKMNQPKLHKSCVDAFENAGKLPNYISIDKDHGRNEVRNAFLINKLPDHIKVNWPEVNAIVKIESAREEDNEQSNINRYFITSSKKKIEYIAKGIRSHWGIENLVHRHLDVSFKEDGSRIRKGFGAENASTLRRLALVLINKCDSIKGSLDIKRLFATWSNSSRLAILGGFI